MYRDWLYGDERRYANYVGLSLAALAIFLFFYTMRVMSAETWDIPAPVLASQRKKLERERQDGEEADAPSDAGVALTEKAQRQDALAMLKRPQTVSRPTAAF
ncbi:hypothetical protein STCU_03368 [Strigomonas culicis]|uniref:Uncharacterized protein n=1 Tax=Strigomonas culicis TaxID=28005 RepID=S9ULA9_9TRYP|nr:hypothetical protein STCU_03368 [Strigomonas culicis]|eukprot:EPY31612.1 hypothetical protein STCU_03368 [Strigomonas culicis]